MRPSDPRRRAATLGSILLVALAATTAAYGRHHRAALQDPAAAGQFDYYLLSLSWSPSYCLIHPEDQQQCTRGYGFVLHGLWPQNDAGGYPRDCAAAGSVELSAEARQLGQTLFPSPKLMQHEWERHGRCSGLDAVGFFRTADRALARVRVPAALEAPRTSLSMSATDIVAAFRAANPALAADGLAVTCNRDALAEVRVCLSRTLALRSCGRGVRSHCPDVPLRIPAAR
jgi:ribonuclease T2